MATNAAYGSEPSAPFDPSTLHQSQCRPAQFNLTIPIPSLSESDFNQWLNNPQSTNQRKAEPSVPPPTYDSLFGRARAWSNRTLQSNQESDREESSPLLQESDCERETQGRVNRVLSECHVSARVGWGGGMSGMRRRLSLSH